MFDFGFSELLLLAVIALVVLGPERLPIAARLLGRWIRAARSQWNAVKSELENEIADEDLRRDLREASDAMRQGTQQLRDMHQEVAGAGSRMSRLRARAPAKATEASEPVSEAVVTTPEPAEPSAIPIHPAQLSLLAPDTHAAATPSAERPPSDG